MTIDKIYQRYTTALDRVTGRGVWMDAGAVRLAMQLAIDDAFAVGMAEQRQQSSGTFQAYASQISRLAEYLVTCGHDADALLDCAPAQIVDRAIGVIAQLRSEHQPPTADDSLAAWLAANFEAPLIGDTPTAQALNALTTLADIVAAQRAALTELAAARTGLAERVNTLDLDVNKLRILLATAEERISARDIDLANERQLPESADAIFVRLARDVDSLAPADVALVELMAYWLEIAKECRRQLAADATAAADATTEMQLTVTDTTHGNGKTAPALATPAAKATMPPGLSTVAEEYWEGCERRVHPFRKLPIEIRLEIVQAVLGALAGDSAVTMAEYDALKPAWMPTASGLPKQFGCSWLDLPTLPPDRLLVAA